MNSAAAKRLARLFPTHWERHYTVAKLKSDPLYHTIESELAGSDLPLLDIGCGIGLLALYLRERGHAYPIHGFDYDARKINVARQAVALSTFTSVSFDEGDARHTLPDHLGNVTILDILQFFTHDEQQQLLRNAAQRVQPGGKLVIRSTIRDNSWRYRVTYAGDIIAKASLWMKAAPTHYPAHEDFHSALDDFGTVSIRPLWGRTPFNNHLIVLERSL